MYFHVLLPHVIISQKLLLVYDRISIYSIIIIMVLVKYRNINYSPTKKISMYRMFVVIFDKKQMPHKILRYFSQDCKISHKWSKQACGIKFVMFFKNENMSRNWINKDEWSTTWHCVIQTKKNVNLIRNFIWCCLTINTDRNVANIVIMSRGSSYLSSRLHTCTCTF